MKKEIMVVLAGLLLSGCVAGVETRKGWHFTSLPPSSGKRLAAQCDIGAVHRQVLQEDPYFRGVATGYKLGAAGCKNIETETPAPQEAK